MIVRQRIWEELRYAKANIICVQRYTDRIRRYSRIFNTVIILCASTGAIGGVYNQWIAVCASVLVAISSTLKAILPNFIQSEQDLCELDKLMDFYNSYLNTLERIWYDHDNKLLEEGEIIQKLFGAKESECDKQSILNKGIRAIPKREMRKINEKAREYIERVYFKYPDENEKN